MLRPEATIHILNLDLNLLNYYCLIISTQLLLYLFEMILFHEPGVLGLGLGLGVGLGLGLGSGSGLG